MQKYAVQIIETTQLVLRQFKHFIVVNRKLKSLWTKNCYWMLWIDEVMSYRL